MVKSYQYFVELSGDKALSYNGTRGNMEESKQGNFEFAIRWQSDLASHRDRIYVPRVNLWRDFFPGQLAEKLNELSPGMTVEESFQPGDIFDPFQQNRIYKFSKRKFNLEKLAEKGIRFQVGRYYPRSALASVGFLSSDMRPFRVLENTEDQIVVDINHPLHKYMVTVSGEMVDKLESRFERGGACNDIVYSLVEGGSGLQSIEQTVKPDYFSFDPFVRENETPDGLFYDQPRMVNHIDETAQKRIKEIYGRFLQPGMSVLDLMSSWNSHVPESASGLEITGLGLNTEEMAKNSLLSKRVVHDLNDQPHLPFEDKFFDLAVCTVSIEYLTDPATVFEEIARVLKPGSSFVITFSDRWFPPKVTRLWTELHPFERQSLVGTYFAQSGLFENIHTESVKGYPRSETDLYFKQRNESDPVFAVWGTVKS